MVAKGADVNAQDGNGDTPLMIASRKGHERLVGLLAGERGVVLDAKNKSGQTALHLASKEHTQAAKILLGAGASADIADATGQIPLHYASDQENVELLGPLLEKTSNPNAQDDEGNTALHVTDHHQSSRLKSVKVLLEHAKVDPNVLNNEGESPLHAACMGITGNYQLALEMIRSKRFDLDLPTKEKRNTAAHIAAEVGSDEVLQALIAEGADLQVTNSDKEIPLEVMLRKGQEKCVQSYIDSLGVDALANFQISGLSLIEWATIFSHPSVEESLNKKGIYFVYQKQKLEKMFGAVCGKGVYHWEKNVSIIPIKIKEFREHAEDLKNRLAQSDAPLQQPEMFALAKKAFVDFLKKRALVAEHKQKGTHVFLMDLVFGGAKDLEWYMKDFFHLLPSKLRKMIGNPFDQELTPEMVEAFVSKIPEKARFLLNREFSLNELQGMLPLIEPFLASQMQNMPI